jgi:DNA-binding beta-propeller fold protein YncE
MRNRSTRPGKSTMRSRSLQRHSKLVRTCLLLLLNGACLDTVSAQVVDTPNTLYRVAGGPFREARFCFPQGIAVDGAGNLYVADTRNSTIRQITPEGLVSTVAGKARANRTNLGSLPGTVANPVGIAVIGDRRLAITTENHDVLGINF